MKNTFTQKRMINYDMLRILAAFSVVMLHTSAQFWYSLPLNGSNWLIANSYNAVSRFGVPLFVMLSGALFLSGPSETDFKKLYLHNILRLFVIYSVWSCIYGLTDCLRGEHPPLSAGFVLREMLYGRYHLWYIPMLIGIYMLVPVLKIWVQHAGQKNIQYFLLLFLIFQIGKETINAVLFSYSEVVYSTSLIAPEMVCSYIGYFILGYYISRYGIDKKYHKPIYFSIIPAALCNIFLSSRLSRWKGQPLATVDDSFGFFTFVITAALFLFFTTRSSSFTSGTPADGLITELSKDTLGIYLMHIGLIEFLEPFGIHSMTLPGLIGIPLFTVFCYVTCTALAAILRRIPFVGRYLC